MQSRKHSRRNVQYSSYLLSKCLSKLFPGLLERLKYQVVWYSLPAPTMVEAALEVLSLPTYLFLRFCAKFVTMIRSGQYVINNGRSHIIVNFEHYNGKQMNTKMMNSKGKKPGFENACSRHKKRIFEKEGLDRRGNTSQKYLFT